MRDRDTVRARALRCALGTIDNAEGFPTAVRMVAIEVASVGVGDTAATRRELRDGILRDVLRQEIDEREAAAIGQVLAY